MKNTNLYNRYIITEKKFDENSFLNGFGISFLIQKLSQQISSLSTFRKASKELQSSIASSK